MGWKVGGGKGGGGGGGGTAAVVEAVEVEDKDKGVAGVRCEGRD